MLRHPRITTGAYGLSTPLLPSSFTTAIRCGPRRGRLAGMMLTLLNRLLVDCDFRWGTVRHGEKGKCIVTACAQYRTTWTVGIGSTPRYPAIQHVKVRPVMGLTEIPLHTVAGHCQGTEWNYARLQSDYYCHGVCE